jgi:hypothetical protein
LATTATGASTSSGSVRGPTAVPFLGAGGLGSGRRTPGRRGVGVLDKGLQLFARQAGDEGMSDGSVQQACAFAGLYQMRPSMVSKMPTPTVLSGIGLPVQ